MRYSNTTSTFVSCTFAQITETRSVIVDFAIVSVITVTHFRCDTDKCRAEVLALSRLFDVTFGMSRCPGENVPRLWSTEGEMSGRRCPMGRCPGETVHGKCPRPAMDDPTNRNKQRRNKTKLRTTIVNRTHLRNNVYHPPHSTHIHAAHYYQIIYKLQSSHLRSCAMYSKILLHQQNTFHKIRISTIAVGVSMTRAKRLWSLDTRTWCRFTQMPLQIYSIARKDPFTVSVYQ